MTRTIRSIAASAGLVAVSTLPVLWFDAQPRDPAEVAAIFPPWMAADTAFARAIASGRVVRTGIIDSIVVVHADRPGLIERLYRNGAWAVIDPVAFGGCLVKERDGAA